MNDSAVLTKLNEPSKIEQSNDLVNASLNESAMPDEENQNESQMNHQLEMKIKIILILIWMHFLKKHMK